jgi:hypothetical protein
MYLKNRALTDFNGISPSNSVFVVGDGTKFVGESGATALTSLGATASDGSVAYTSTGVGFRDEDDMLSNDATAPPSQQSVSAFLYSIVSYLGDVVTYDGDVVTY